MARRLGLSRRNYARVQLHRHAFFEPRTRPNRCVGADSGQCGGSLCCYRRATAFVLPNPFRCRLASGTFKDARPARIDAIKPNAARPRCVLGASSPRKQGEVEHAAYAGADWLKTLRPKPPPANRARRPSRRGRQRSPRRCATTSRPCTLRTPGRRPAADTLARGYRPSSPPSRARR